MDNFNLGHFLEFMGDAVKDYYMTNDSFPTEPRDTKVVIDAARDYSLEVVFCLQRLDKVETMSNIRLKNKELSERGE